MNPIDLLITARLDALPESQKRVLLAAKADILETMMRHGKIGPLALILAERDVINKASEVLGDELPKS